MGIIRLQPEVVVSKLPVSLREFSDETLIENFESDLKSSSYQIEMVAESKISDVKDFDAGLVEAVRDSSNPPAVEGIVVQATNPDGSNEFLKGPTGQGPDIIWESPNFLEIYKLNAITIRIAPEIFNSSVSNWVTSFDPEIQDYTSFQKVMKNAAVKIDPAVKTQTISLEDAELLYTWKFPAEAKYRDILGTINGSAIHITPMVITRPATADEVAGVAQYQFEVRPIQSPLNPTEVNVLGSAYRDIQIKYHVFKTITLKDSLETYLTENSLGKTSLGNLAIFSDVNLVTVTYPQQPTGEAKDVAGYREKIVMAFQTGTTSFHDIQVLVIDNAKMRSFRTLEGTHSSEREASLDPNKPLRVIVAPELINIRILAKKYFDAYQVAERVDPDKENLIVTQSKVGVVISAAETLLRTSSDANKIRPTVKEGYSAGDRIKIPTADAIKAAKVVIKPVVIVRRLKDWLTLKERTSKKDYYREKWLEENWSGNLNKLDKADRKIVNLISPVLTDTEFKNRRRGVTIPLGVVMGAVQNCDYVEQADKRKPIYLTYPEPLIPGTVFQIMSTAPPRSSQYWF
ncbi:hypothetical protein [Yersinia ruckeri]|uniref:hypothetical protein n=1 Tax=Yersinia ruckeri TaxID=29486 RepID=UPI002237E68E|nr:hypothetical protein [Yersinia ruckeri]MCW6598848.1 hypothetical protein [Yersinia ruckeri]